MSGTTEYRVGPRESLALRSDSGVPAPRGEPRPDALTTGPDPRANPSPSSLGQGDIVAERYRIEQTIGSGGNGSVFRARHLGLDLPVAIKVLHLEGLTEAEGAQLVRRFEREARTTARIHHRNVLAVHDTGRLPDGSPYLVMELIDGEDLEQRVARAPLEIAAVVDLGRQLFAGLCAIAEMGVLHRDVKPANLMLHREADGQVLVKLVDFGIARTEAAESRLTVAGVIMGTPHYMAPEHLRGEELDERSDLYAASAVLYEAATGRPPFDGASSPLVIGQILGGSLVPVRELRPDCPAALADLVERGLSRRREDRPDSALDVVATLEQVARTAGLATGALPWTERAVPAPAAPGPRVSPRPDVETADVPRVRAQPPAPRDDGDGAGAASADATAPRWVGHAVLFGVTVSLLAAAVTAGVALSSPSAPAEAAPPVASSTPPAVDVDALLDEGLEALARGEVDAALGHYRAAALAAPDRPEAVRGRALAATRAGLDGEAIIAFERYLVLAPDAGDAPRVRARLAALRARRASSPLQPRP